jgi:uncharacterized protein (TIGR02391 family)
MSNVSKLSQNILKNLSDIFGDTNTGLTGSEIERTLAESNIPDVEPDITKRHRLFTALNSKQENDGCANNVLAYIQKLMDPVNHLQNKNTYNTTLQSINEIVSFVGLELGEDGKFKMVSSKATTISEAQARASKLRKKLIDRNVHSDVLKFCKTELLQDNYFHAVFEATKSVADKIREKTGLASDGAKLIDTIFGLGKTNQPKLAINILKTETDLSEHKGFVNLLKGFFGMFRNTTGHVPKIKWEIKEEDALDILTLASVLHRKLDKGF